MEIKLKQELPPHYKYITYCAKTREWHAHANQPVLHSLFGFYTSLGGQIKINPIVIAPPEFNPDQNYLCEIGENFDSLLEKVLLMLDGSVPRHKCVRKLLSAARDVYHGIDTIS